jgi:hypothetical protein
MPTKQSLALRYFLPFLQWFGLMIVTAIAIDYLLHRLQLVNVGRYLGYFGTFLIIASFVYSLRKRKIIQTGSPKTFLALHEYMSWAGSVLVIVHAGIHFNAILPWLALLMLLIVVASGLVGKFLLKNAAEALKEKKKALVASGISPEAADHQLHFDSITVDVMKKWRVVHLPITLILGILALLHIITVVMFWK